jgi:beta-lactamase superfamily II metal-dependent hydrolase
LTSQIPQYIVMEVDPRIVEKKHGFAVYPSIFVKNFRTVRGTRVFSNVKHILFGDWVGLELENELPVYQEINEKIYVKVHARNRSGYVLPDQIQFDRVLEVNFIDVGQGDGCHIVTPDDKHFIVDAGASDNMFRFLKWRFNRERSFNGFPNFDVVISHSDSDHYGGFERIFADPDGNPVFKINKIYHNGIVEETGELADSLGTLFHSDGIEYLTELCPDQESFATRVNNASRPGNYIELLKSCDAEKIGLSSSSGQLHRDEKCTIEILGPVVKTIEGRQSLPVFGDSAKSKKGKTKNGHSVILKLNIGKVRMLLGGDLNEPSEDYLLHCYTGIDVGVLRAKLRNRNTSEEDRRAASEQKMEAISRAKEIFGVDIAKSCHHGSADFTSEFLGAVNPIATVISSGDNEPHSHPRPDTLGTIGKYSRGERSLIFSTELARSANEFIDLVKLKEKLEANPELTKERAVVVYGMINVRTDGKNIIIAQKLERPAPRGEWDIHELVWDSAIEEFKYVS